MAGDPIEMLLANSIITKQTASYPSAPTDRSGNRSAPSFVVERRKEKRVCSRGFVCRGADAARRSCSCAALGAGKAAGRDLAPLDIRAAGEALMGGQSGARKGQLHVTVDPVRRCNFIGADRKASPVCLAVIFN